MKEEKRFSLKRPMEKSEDEPSNLYGEADSSVLVVEGEEAESSITDQVAVPNIATQVLMLVNLIGLISGDVLMSLYSCS